MMQANNNSVEFCIDILATRVAEEIARQKEIAAKEAIRLFMATKTYGLLIDTESRLYLESFEYVMDMLAAEESEDWSRWLEV
jgi:hypothetical protein